MSYPVHQRPTDQSQEDWPQVQKIMERYHVSHNSDSSHLKHHRLVAHHSLATILDTPFKLYIVAWRLGVTPRELEEFIGASPLTLNINQLPPWANEALMLSRLSPASLAYFVSDVERDPQARAKIFDQPDQNQLHLAEIRTETEEGKVLHLYPDVIAKCQSWSRPYHMYGVSTELYGNVGFIDVLRKDQRLADELFREEILTGWFQVRTYDKLPKTQLC